MITVLCAARSSVYRAIPGLDVFTRSRDAWTARPSGPVIAHPPCRCWCRAWPLSAMTVKTRIIEMLLGMECVRLVIHNGGILEQPAHSRLWKCASLPGPSEPFAHRHAWTIELDQAQFGHRASKPTWILFSGIRPSAVNLNGWQLQQEQVRSMATMTPGQRSSSPPLFARFLVQCAASARPMQISPAGF